MKIEDLRIELRPRSNAQALDLGFALLRAHAAPAYLAFLALWLPLIALCAVFTALLPKYGWAAMLLAWWLKPLLERAPLYVLSRQVFGSAVTWKEAVRAWPGQLGGGWLRLLIWGRPFAAGRALYQPIWQLELARGNVASKRMGVIGRDGTGVSAFWFGVVCAHLEVVLQFGAFGFIGIFFDSAFRNPFILFTNLADAEAPWFALLALGIYALAAAIMAPIYTACGFTLYLIRRASLEAWDIEIALRQIRPPVRGRAARGAHSGVAQALLMVAGTLLLSLSMTLAPEAQAAPAKPPCQPLKQQYNNRSPFPTPEQARVRRQLDQIYAGNDLRGYECTQSWFLKKVENRADRQKNNFQLDLLASLLKGLFIAIAVAAAAWLLYRYGHKLPLFSPAPKAAPATEVGGLDIRAESLPPDVTANVIALWTEGQRRAALALLYRATLSRLVAEDALPVRQGHTEGDCLRLARRAGQEQTLSAARVEVAIDTTSLWLGGAYGERWPDDGKLLACCRQWDAQYGPAREAAA